MVISFCVSEFTDYSWKFVLRSTSRRRRRCCRKQHSYTLGIDKPQRNACGFSLLRIRRVLYSVVISFIVSECTDYSWKCVLRSTSRRRRRCCCRKQHSYTSGIEKPQRNACGFSLLRMRRVLYSVVISFFPNAQIILGSSFCDQRPDVVVDVVGSSTLLLQELTNRNEMLVVFHCYACAGFYTVWSSVLLFPNAQIIQRPDVVVDVVVGSSTLTLQELTNRNEMLVVFHCYACAGFYTVWSSVLLFPNAQIILGSSFCDQRPDVVVDVVGSSTLLLQELTNRNEMLVVFHCYACAGFYTVWSSVLLFPHALIILGSSFCNKHRDGDVVVRSSTLIHQEFTNRNEMLVVFHEHCYSCAGCSTLWPSVSLLPNARIIFGGSFCDQRPDFVVDVVVGSGTLILQELSNRNQMLVVFHEHCYACDGFLRCAPQFYCFSMHL